MDKRTENLINQIYREVYKKIFNKAAYSSLTSGSKVTPLINAQLLENSKQYDKFCEEFAKKLAKAGLARKRGVWRKFYNVAKEQHYVALPTTFHEYEMKSYSAQVRENFNMIKSIPKEVVKMLEHKYVSTLMEEVAKGTIARGSFEKQLASHGHKNARLIARTESAKLQTSVTRLRATDLGLVAYIWLSSNDKRTRPSHRAMNGVVVFWRPQTQKPLLDGMRGDAGEFPNCRCDAQPITSEDELKNNFYKVYDWTTDKVITLTKRQLIEKMQSI